MLRLLAITLFLSSTLFAQSTKAIHEFLEENYEKNPSISSFTLLLKDEVALQEPIDFKAYTFQFSAMLKNNRKVDQAMIWFANDTYIVPDLVNMRTNESYKKSLKTSVSMKSTYGTKKDSSTLVKKHLTTMIGENPNIVSLNLNITDRLEVDVKAGWYAYIVKLSATLKDKRNVKQKMIWFANGDVIAQDLIDLDTGLSSKEFVAPSFQSEYYKKENLIYGNANAKHKVAFFSDPLCPFCRRFVPKAIEKMKAHPSKIALYYYHFPLEAIHPASVTLTKAAIAAEFQGHKDTVLKMYKVVVDAKEKDPQKILHAFNKVVGSNVKVKDLLDPRVVKHFEHDMYVAEELMVGGTPTLFFDGKVDKSKKKYEQYLKGKR